MRTENQTDLSELVLVEAAVTQQTDAEARAVAERARVTRHTRCHAGILTELANRTRIAVGLARSGLIGAGQTRVARQRAVHSSVLAHVTTKQQRIRQRPSSRRNNRNNN